MRIIEWLGREWRDTKRYLNYKEERAPAIIWIAGGVALLVFILMMWF